MPEEAISPGSIITKAAEERNKNTKIAAKEATNQANIDQAKEKELKQVRELEEKPITPAKLSFEG